MIDLQPNLELTTAHAESLLGAWLGGAVACSGIRPLKGGLVNTVLELTFNRPPHRAVVKLHGKASDTFGVEAQSLRYIRTETACPVPEVYLQDSSGRLIPHAFLLLEEIPGVRLNGLDLPPDDRADIERQLADVLGELHSHAGSAWGGLGPDDQRRTWADHFADRLAETRAYPSLSERLPPPVLSLVDEAIDLARPALQNSGTPTLVHGDVWDGNLMVEQQDGRWRITGLLDPEIQFADVELELAYLEVFDVPRDTFFAAYTRHHSLRPGYEQRRLFYWLRTGLLHVALFGDEFFCDFTARIAERICRLPAL